MSSFITPSASLSFHAAFREHLLCPVYCIMPDHIHLIWMGLRAESDQRNAMAFLRTYLEPHLAPHYFQPQAHDHVLGTEERRHNSFAQHCSYILQNPVRARLVTTPDKWSHHGAIVPGYPQLEPLEHSFWPTFWKLYHQLRDPTCTRHLPRRSTVQETSGDL
jgi:putative transposase